MPTADRLFGCSPGWSSVDGLWTCWKMVEAWSSEERFVPFLLGNAAGPVLRWPCTPDLLLDELPPFYRFVVMFGSFLKFCLRGSDVISLFWPWPNALFFVTAIESEGSLLIPPNCVCDLWYWSPSRRFCCWFASVCVSSFSLALRSWLVKARSSSKRESVWLAHRC